MTGVMTLYRTSIGKKVIMAVSGIILIGFLLVHMYGNTKMFLGPEVYNAYAAGLRELGHPIFGYEHLLWIMRVVLVSSIVLHMWSASALSVQTQASAGTNAVLGLPRYKRQKSLQATYASRTMRWGGILIFLFVSFHLLHLTFGQVGFAAGAYQPEHNGEFEVYNNIVRGFQSPIVSGFYILMMIAIGFHLYHGIWSAFQTLGLNSSANSRVFRGIAIFIAVLFVLVNCTFPIAIMSNVVTLR